MRFFGYSDRHLDVRVAPRSESGQYAIGEIAIRDHVDGKDYVTAVGIAFRRDEMSDDFRRRREELDKANDDKDKK